MRALSLSFPEPRFCEIEKSVRLFHMNKVSGARHADAIEVANFFESGSND